MLLTIDFQSEIPIYTQIQNAIIKGIANGTLKKNEELPSIRSLSNELGVNLHTVNKAYKKLQDDGIIQMQRGRGATVHVLPISEKVFKKKTSSRLQEIVNEAIIRNVDRVTLHVMVDTFFDQNRG